eukprot:CAMPEP_0172167108 /NCGR_PEP_ID=MMETSP1050-20130122/9381_1 /TAXON_ID=233186 /ORGANISM="Cryptomonas curvata, Strain CCAP979/52" /LENGTH=1022 /DNA_ID=CAMNT_0012837847 /DNA_START=57 /DNA_END=3125 /DNA_ORIENTATION=-
MDYIHNRDVPILRGDPGRIKQILHNLLDNAVKFTRKGNITLLVEVDKDCRNVILSVKDTGPGVPVEQLTKIWGAFSQGDEGMARTFGGTGLGLTIAQQLAEAHGGKISVSSQVGAGSTFSLMLPIKKVPEEAGKEFWLKRGDSAATPDEGEDDGELLHTKERRESGTMHSYSELHKGIVEVLSIDDDPINQLVIEGLLAPQGFVFTPAMNGDEALQILSKRGYLPDIVLLDCQMPGMQGFEVCTALRGLYPESLPILMVSSNADEENIIKGFRVGSNDYIRKPFSSAEVLARIRTQLRLRDLWLREVEESRKSRSIIKMIPQNVLDRLQAGDSTALLTDDYKMISVLTCEFCDLPVLAIASKSNSDLVLVVNDVLASFDNLVAKHDVYKVDTSAEGYMVVSGHDEKSRNDHYHRVFNMAVDMLSAVKTVMLPNESYLSLRIGIHCGPAHAAVIGVKQPVYAFFGSTINITGRLESKCFPNCIHVSAAFQELVGDKAEWVEYSELCLMGSGRVATFVPKVGDWRAAVLGGWLPFSGARTGEASPIFNQLAFSRSAGNIQRAYQKVLNASVFANDAHSTSKMHVPAANAAQFKLLDMSCLSASSLSTVYSVGSQIPVAKAASGKGDSILYSPKAADVDLGLSIPDHVLTEGQSMDSIVFEQHQSTGEIDLEARVRELLNQHDQQLPSGHLIPTQDPDDMMASAKSKPADNFAAASLEEQTETDVVACCEQEGAASAAAMQDQQSKFSNLEAAAASEGIAAAAATAAAIHKKEADLAASLEAARNREAGFEQILLDQERSFQRKESVAVAAARKEGEAALVKLHEQQAELEHRLLEQEKTQESKIQAALLVVRQEASSVLAEARQRQMELEQQLLDLKRACPSAAADAGGTASATAQETVFNVRPHSSSGQGQGPAEMYVSTHLIERSVGDQALPLGQYTVHSTTETSCWLGDAYKPLPSITSTQPGSTETGEVAFTLEEAGWLLSWLWKRLGRPRVTMCMCGLAALEAGDIASGGLTEVRWSFA